MSDRYKDAPELMTPGHNIELARAGVSFYPQDSTDVSGCQTWQPLPAHCRLDRDRGQWRRSTA